eukprot:PhF_6_TR2544/c0_g1_i2/m.4319
MHATTFQNIPITKILLLSIAFFSVGFGFIDPTMVTRLQSHPLYRILNIAHCGTPSSLLLTLSIIHTLRILEYVYGSKKFLTRVVLVYVLEVMIRVAFGAIFSEEEDFMFRYTREGPHTLVTYFTITYLLQFPCVANYSGFPVSGKSLLAILFVHYVLLTPSDADHLAGSVVSCVIDCIAAVMLQQCLVLYELLRLKGSRGWTAWRWVTFPYEWLCRLVEVKMLPLMQQPDSVAPFQVWR